MRRAYTVVVLAVVLMALGGVVYLGIGQQPAVDSGDKFESGGISEREPTEPAYDQRTDSESAFGFRVDEVDSCGMSCRDVTATVTNTQAEKARNAEVSTSLYAGENTTTQEALVWERTEDIGTLDAGESYTTTRRVDLSFGEATAIQGADGWITIRTTVESAERTVSFQRTRQVL